MANTPTDIANQSLDAIGLDFTLGDIEEGTRPAQVTLRAYRECLKQLLRAVHWNFARRQAPMVLLADATGSTAALPNLTADPEFLYEYAWPPDCLKARFVPWNPLQNPGAPAGNIVPANPNAPLTSAPIQTPGAGMKLRPARFLVGTDFNYIPNQGNVGWEIQGVSPQGQSVILTNVRNASLVYTALTLYPSLWDAEFRAAFVAYLASEIALPLSKDKKFGLQLRKEQIAIVKQKVTQARITDGNEAWSSTDHVPDWIRVRQSGGTAAGWGFYGMGGPGSAGVTGYGWDSLSFADGAAY